MNEETESTTVFSLRKPTPVARPAKTQKISDHYGITKPDELTDAELGRSIVLTVALPAFVIGCLIGMLL